MRSLMFVPGDNVAKLAKAMVSGADALIIDLEDSVAASAKESARETLADFLLMASPKANRPHLFVRVNSLDTGLIDADLDVVMKGKPDAIVLPKSQGGVDVTHLSAKLAVREAENNLPDGSTRIIAIATETAKAVFGLGTYAGSSNRLVGMTWGGEDLSADIGAETNRKADGTYAGPYMLARSLTLLGAAASEVAAIDTIYTNYRDLDGLKAECEAARRDGFIAKMAIHPGQIPIINESFSPTAEALAKALAIVEAFAANPGAGVIGLNGEMLDVPHLRRAQRTLARQPRGV